MPRAQHRWYSPSNPDLIAGEVKLCISSQSAPFSCETAPAVTKPPTAWAAQTTDHFLLVLAARIPDPVWAGLVFLGPLSWGLSPGRADGCLLPSRGCPSVCVCVLTSSSYRDTSPIIYDHPRDLTSPEPSLQRPHGVAKSWTQPSD